MRQNTEHLNTEHRTPICQSPHSIWRRTVASGQNFRWRRDVEGVWWGVVGQTVVAAWQEEGRPDSPLHWQTFPQPDQRALIRDYFQLDVDLLPLVLRNGYGRNRAWRKR